MKCLKIAGLIILLTLVTGTSGYAADPTPASIGVTADVPAYITFKVELYGLKKVGTNWEPNFADPRGAIDFGTLVSAGTDSVTGEDYALQGEEGYCVVVYAANNERPYHINYEGEPLGFGGDSLSSDAYTATLDYHYGSDGKAVAIPAGSSFSAKEKRSAVTTSPWKVYTATSPSYFPFRIYLGITADPDEAVGTKKLIGAGQTGGKYTGSITLTLVSD